MSPGWEVSEPDRLPEGAEGVPTLLCRRLTGMLSYARDALVHKDALGVSHMDQSEGALI